MRYTNKDLPPYKFIPGLAPHPEKEGYLRGVTIEAGDFSASNYDSNETYLYAIDLFNLEYFWEAHVYWEVLWNYVGRKTSHGYFLQALIKLAAAGVKSKQGHDQAVKGHENRALEHLDSVVESQLYGLSKDTLRKQIENHGHKFKLVLD
jgi:hypothetical protein